MFLPVHFVDTKWDVTRKYKENNINLFWNKIFPYESVRLLGHACFIRHIWDLIWTLKKLVISLLWE